MAVIMNMTTSLDFDHHARESLRQNTPIISIQKKRSLLSCVRFTRQPAGSIERYDTPGAYVYSVKLQSLNREDMLSIELEEVTGLPDAKSKLTVIRNTLDVFIWTSEIELPRDARPGGLRNMTFGLTGDGTFIMVVPRQLSRFRRGVERLKTMIGIYRADDA